MKLYCFFSPSGDAYENLAMDEYLLTHLPSDTHLLYFYVNDNAVIIGRNQNAFTECNLEVMRSQNVQLVRRLTGGGAVYHDKGNLNFSFLSPEGLYDPNAQDEIILSALRSLGVDAERNGRNDFAVHDRKFSGNAFGAKNGTRVRHGTLLISSDLGKLDSYLTVSAKKLRAKGVASVRSRVCNLTEYAPHLTVEEAAEAIRRAFEAHYGMTAEEIIISAKKSAEIDDLRLQRSSFEWIYGEAPAFDYCFEERFSFGMAQFCLSVKDGRIAEAALYTDALDTALSEKAREALLGEVFTPANIQQVLSSTADPALCELGAYAGSNL